jgi:uncharacterized protein (TIGR03382 family)
MRKLICLLMITGCSAGNDSASQSRTPQPATSADRAIAEADIIQLDGGKLYAMSRTGTVSIVDVSQPGQLTLLDQTTLPGEPFEMYRRGDLIVAMANSAVNRDGSSYYYSTSGTPGSSAMVIVLDGQLAQKASFHVPGEIADSRIVGDVLYLATYENAQCYGCGSAPRTMVTTFDLSVPTAMRQVEQVTFQSNAPDGYNLPWGSNWKRSIFVNAERLYIGGHADIDPNDFGTVPEGIIDVLDITDPTGRLVPGPRLRVAGALLSRWQLDERGGVLSVISQKGAGRTGNGLEAPKVETFLVRSTQDIEPLGSMTMTLPRPEGLRTVRFDDTRAYAITYNQTDPLFVIDLTDPEHPQQKGELYMPGFMFHLEPHGDRIIGLGIDRNDREGSLNVSLFDVANADDPKLLQRASFAQAGITEDYEILNGEIAEDQDRIQKAFRVLPDGLVVVPFSALRPYSYYSSGNTGCDNQGGGVQLVRWQSDTLTKEALLPVPGNPRRAFENNGEMLAVSDSNVRSFSLSRLEVAHQTADLTIGTCTPSNSYSTGYLYDDDYRHGFFGCSAAGGGGGGVLFGLLLVAGLLFRRRCA